YRGLLAPADADQAHAGELRDLLRESGVGEVLHLGQGQGVRGEGEGEDWRVGGVGLAVDGRVREVPGQVRAGGVDGRLHLLLRHVDVQVQRELEGDDRAAVRAVRGHLVQARELSELPLQGRGHRRGHHLRAGPRVERDDLYGRVVDLREGRDGKQLEAEGARD